MSNYNLARLKAHRKGIKVVDKKNLKGYKLEVSPSYEIDLYAGIVIYYFDNNTMEWKYVCGGDFLNTKEARQFAREIIRQNK